MSGIHPLADNIVIRPSEAESTTAAGLVIPDIAQEKSQKGVVVAVGPGRVDDHGKRVPMDVTEGDVVLHQKYGGTEIRIDGEDLLIFSIRDVIAVID